MFNLFNDFAYSFVVFTKVGLYDRKTLTENMNTLLSLKLNDFDVNDAH